MIAPPASTASRTHRAGSEEAGSAVLTVPGRRRRVRRGPPYSPCRVGGGRVGRGPPYSPCRVRGGRVGRTHRAESEEAGPPRSAVLTVPSRRRRVGRGPPYSPCRVGGGRVRRGPPYSPCRVGGGGSAAVRRTHRAGSEEAGSAAVRRTHRAGSEEAGSAAVRRTHRAGSEEAGPAEPAAQSGPPADGAELTAPGGPPLQEDEEAVYAAAADREAGQPSVGRTALIVSEAPASDTNNSLRLAAAG